MKIDLIKPDLKALEVGTIVITTNGFEFTRTTDGWEDMTSGLKWFYPESGKLNYAQAMEKYNAPSKRLPTKEEFEDAEKHGFREILEIISGWFWSSSVNPFFTDYAYDFYGYNGVVFSGIRGDYYGAALCVSGR